MYYYGRARNVELYREKNHFWVTFEVHNEDQSKRNLTVHPLYTNYHGFLNDFVEERTTAGCASVLPRFVYQNDEEMVVKMGKLFYASPLTIPIMMTNVSLVIFLFTSQLKIMIFLQKRI